MLIPWLFLVGPVEGYKNEKKNGEELTFLLETELLCEYLFPVFLLLLHCKKEKNH